MPNELNLKSSWDGVNATFKTYKDGSALVQISVNGLGGAIGITLTSADRKKLVAFLEMK